MYVNVITDYFYYRCVLSMDGSAVDQQTMEYLVKQDLAMNVRKDGRWGSYRHLPIDKCKLMRSTGSKKTAYSGKLQ